MSCWDSSGTPILCAGTGQDGEIQAGATLHYNDNGNGTITDRNTRLTWEKKSDDEAVNDDDNTTFSHDKDNRYTWDEAFAHVDMLNNTCANDEMVTCSADADCVAAGVGRRCGFAGKRDWRVPNMRELQSIQNYEIPQPGPVVSPAFHTDCVADATVLTGSCTEAFNYWSSTTDADDLNNAWTVNFFDHTVFSAGKIFTDHVRAVRGGL